VICVPKYGVLFALFNYCVNQNRKLCPNRFNTQAASRSHGVCANADANSPRARVLLLTLVDIEMYPLEAETVRRRLFCALEKENKPRKLHASVYDCE